MSHKYIVSGKIITERILPFLVTMHALEVQNIRSHIFLDTGNFPDLDACTRIQNMDHSSYNQSRFSTFEVEQLSTGAIEVLFLRKDCCCIVLDPCLHDCASQK